MYPKDDIDTGENTPSVYEQAAIPTFSKRQVEQPFDVKFLENHKTKESYDKMYVLIGQVKKLTARSKGRQGNPFGIIVGRYTECPACHDVAVEYIQRDYNAGSNKTYVRHMFMHWDGRMHSEHLGSIDGKHTYEELVKLKKEGKM